MEKKKLAVALPLSWSHVYSPFFLSFVQMVMRSGSDFAISIYTSNTSLIDKMREVLADEIQTIEPDYILWIDADQLYPMDTMERLAKHIDSGHLVVGGITPDKHTAKPMVYNFVNEIGTAIPARSFEINRGLVKVDAMGFGGIMMHPSVLKTIKTPYFPRTWDAAMESFIGEDFGFYIKCKNAGIDVWCDTDLHYSHMIAEAINVNRSKNCSSWDNVEFFGRKRKVLEENVVPG